jgi:hypothetical protein
MKDAKFHQNNSVTLISKKAPRLSTIVLAFQRSGHRLQVLEVLLRLCYSLAS